MDLLDLQLHRREDLAVDQVILRMMLGVYGVEKDWVYGLSVRAKCSVMGRIGSSVERLRRMGQIASGHVRLSNS